MHQVFIFHGMDLSPIRNLVALGVPEGKVRLFDIDAQEWLESLEVPDSTKGVQVYTPEFSHDGRLIASTTHDGRAVLWDVESRGLKWAFPLKWPGGARITFSADDRMVVVVDRAAMWGLDVETGEVLFEEPLETRYIPYAPIITTDIPGHFYVSLWDSAERDASGYFPVRFQKRSTSTGKVLEETTLVRMVPEVGGLPFVEGVWISPDESRWLHYGSYRLKPNNQKFTWISPVDPETMQPEQTFIFPDPYPDRINTGDFSPDASRLALTVGYQTYVMDLDRLELLHTLFYLPADGGYSGAAFNRDGTIVAGYAWTDTLRVWRIPTSSVPPGTHNGVSGSPFTLSLPGIGGGGNDEITFSLETASPLSVNIDIVNVLGESVSHRYGYATEAGRRDVTLDASHLPSGTYWVRATSAGYQIVHPIVVKR